MPDFPAKREQLMPAIRAGNHGTSDEQLVFLFHYRVV